MGRLAIVLLCVSIQLAVAEVDKEIGFLVASNGGIDFYNVTNVDYDGEPSHYQQLLNTGSTVYGIDYHWSKKLIFGLDSNHLFRTTFQDDDLPAMGRVLLTRMYPTTYITGLAVDWVRDRVIFPEQDGNKGDAIIKSVDLEGRDHRVLMTRPKAPANIRRLIVDPYAGILFWVYGDEYSIIETFTFYGNKHTQMVDSVVLIREITLDLKTRRLFYLDSTYSMKSVDYTGEKMKKHWTLSTMTSLFGLTLFRGVFYWDKDSSSVDTVYSTPLNQSSKTRKIYVNKRRVYALRLVHWTLQTDQCEGQNCKELSPTTAIQDELDTSVTTVRTSSSSSITTSSTLSSKAATTPITNSDLDSDALLNTILIKIDDLSSILSTTKQNSGPPNELFDTSLFVVFNTVISLVLLVILVIILCLFIGFKKQEKNDKISVRYNRSSGLLNHYEPCGPP